MKITQAIFAGSSTSNSMKPAERLPEFAFIGRSNVGKSSLINMLTGNGRLAKTSSTPGKTKLINHFRINHSWYLVDLPGYGYAKMPLAERMKLQSLISDYLDHSSELKMLFVLVDSRHDLQKADQEFLREVSESDIPFSIIFTKADKMGPQALKTQTDKYKNQLLDFMPGLPRCFETSAAKGSGRSEVLDFIDITLKQE